MIYIHNTIERRCWCHLYIKRLIFFKWLVRDNCELDVRKILNFSEAICAQCHSKPYSVRCFRGVTSLEQPAFMVVNCTFFTRLIILSGFFLANICYLSFFSWKIIIETLKLHRQQIEHSAVKKVVFDQNKYIHFKLTKLPSPY